MSGALRVVNQVAGSASLVNNLGGVVGEFLQQAIPGFGPVLFRNPRSIDYIIPNVAIEEIHRDRLTITSHPVEMGVAISDHAYKEPVELIMRCGWSNSSSSPFGGLAGAVGGVGAFIGGSAGRAIGTAAGIAGFAGGLIGDLASSNGFEGYVKTIYNQLLSLQNERRPFSVTTGKRQYRNMMITDIEVTTDHTTEFALMATIQLREVILVKLATVRSTQQSAPEKTANPQKGGDKIPVQKEDLPPPPSGPPVDIENTGSPGGSGVPPPQEAVTGPSAGDFPPGPNLTPVPGGSVGPADVGLPGPSGIVDPNANVQAPLPSQPGAATPTPMPAPGSGGIPAPATSGPSFPDPSLAAGT